MFPAMSFRNDCFFTSGSSAFLILHQRMGICILHEKYEGPEIRNVENQELHLAVDQEIHHDTVLFGFEGYEFIMGSVPLFQTVSCNKLQSEGSVKLAEQSVTADAGETNDGLK